MDALRFALDMELDGERYYSRQAEQYAATPLKTVFELLAKDELKHAEIIRGKMDGAAYALKSDDRLSDRESLFSGLKDYKPLAADNPDQARLYHEAVALEQRSIDLYNDLRIEAADDQMKTLFDFLIREESMHRQILEDMYRFVNRPNEWVESAEFGLREEY